MVKCPKCEFEQPEDVFCASCGVNMKSFTAPRTRSKFGLIVVGLALISMAGFLAIKISDSYDKIKTNTLKTGDALDDFNKELNKATKQNTEASKPIPLNDSAIAPVNKSDAVPTAAVSEASASPDATAAPSAVDAEISNQITVEFALAPKETMEKLGLSVGSPGSVVTAIKPPRVLQSLSSETHALDQQQQAHFSQISQEPKSRENIGIQIDVFMSHFAVNNADYKINIKRSIPESGTNGEIRVVSQDFSESINIPAGQGFVLSGLIPRKNLTEAEAPLYSSSILRIMLDPGFQKYEQEFIVLISP